jgi:hypothetical protein
MTGPDHYRLAEELLSDRGVLHDVIVGVAQAHAMLALAAATAMAGDFGSRAEAEAWRQAAGTTTASCLGLRGSAAAASSRHHSSQCMCPGTGSARGEGLTPQGARLSLSAVSGL